jgi:hypothetical protein
LILGQGITMNIYYEKKVGLNVLRMFTGISRGIVICLIGASVVSLPANYIVSDSMIGFILKCVWFACVYGLLLWLHGLNREEKKLAYSLLKRMYPAKI